MPEHLDLDAYALAVDEDFDGSEPDAARWLPFYTPHWASRATTEARRTVADSILTLRIDHDTPPWAPDIDGQTRVSHLQTGQHAGPLGSAIGQHRFRDGLIVREEQPDQRLWLAHFGVITARARAIRHPSAMVALWPIGFEERPEDCGEICIFEIFGSEIDDTGGYVGVGVKEQNDPRLSTDFEKIRVEGDLTAFHEYAVEWLPERLRFFIDGLLVKTVEQAIDYPVQLMLDVYDLSGDGERHPDAYPFTFEVDWVREYRPA